MMKSCEGADLFNSLKNYGTEGTIESILSRDDKYSGRPEYLQCVIKHMMNSKIGDRIIAGNNPIDEVNALKQNAELKCDVAMFLQSPIGIIVLILILLVLTLMCCCCIRRFFC